jgi:hypothetical protein
VVPFGVAHLFEIVVLTARAHALLAGGCPYVLALFLTEEGALELHHAGVGEQESRVIGRHQ